MLPNRGPKTEADRSQFAGIRKWVNHAGKMKCPPTEAKSKLTKGAEVRLLFRIVFMLFLAQLGATTAGTPAQAAGDSAENTPEYQLAIINAKGWVNKDDVTIIRFRFLLNSIQQQTGYPHRKIGDIVAMGRDQVRSHFGKEISLLGFMEEANRVMRSAPRGTKFEEVVALLVVSIGGS